MSDENITAGEEEELRAGSVELSAVGCRKSRLVLKLLGEVTRLRADRERADQVDRLDPPEAFARAVRARSPYTTVSAWYDPTIYPGDAYPCLPAAVFRALRGGTERGPGWREYPTVEAADLAAARAVRGVLGAAPPATPANPLAGDPLPAVHAVIARDGPPPESLWRHVKSGGEYKVLTCGVLEKDMTPVVVYCGASGTWVRPLTEFRDGRFVPAGATPLRPAAETAAAGFGDWAWLEDEPCRFCRAAGKVYARADTGPQGGDAQEVRCDACGRSWETGSSTA
jgi:hypothetical protein